VGYLLLRAGKISKGNLAGLTIFFAGIIAMSIMLGITFADKMSN